MILKAANITKTYAKIPVLSGVSVSLQSGESIAICGKSGQGKTTLLHILGTLEKPDQGEMEIAGCRVTDATAARLRNEQIGFVFQAYHLLDDFTVLENTLMPARIARKLASRSKGLELLSWVGLEAKADLPAKLLSGGEKQRAAIARALCNDPSLILADEPTGNLDRKNGKKIVELLISLKKGLVIVTHDPEIAALCDHEYFLEEGKLCRVTHRTS